MRPNIRSITATVLAAALLLCFSAAPAMAQDALKDDDAQAGQMAADFLVARPLGLAATVIGTAVFIVSLPFSALGGNTQAAGEELVVRPAQYTFKRPLGHFSSK